MSEIASGAWDQFLKQFPDSHLLQSSEWGELKSAFGWQPVRIIEKDCGAQVLFRTLPLGYTAAYLPKGPVGLPLPEFWKAVDLACRKRRAIFIKVEASEWQIDGHTDNAELPGFGESSHSIQPRRTILVDLRGSEEQILARMKQKCRYNIRLAEKKGVTVETWKDIDGFHRMMTITGERDQFGVHSKQYYQRAYDLLVGSGQGEILVARYGDVPLAALMVCARGRNSWYLYGASTDLERNRMPAYLLQWQAMRWARSRGAEWYDLWGVPDEDEATLEANFEKRSDGLWGVYRFKRGFGGAVVRSLASLDKVYQPLFYQAYRFFTRQKP